MYLYPTKRGLHQRVGDQACIPVSWLLQIIWGLMSRISAPEHVNSSGAFCPEVWVPVSQQFPRYLVFWYGFEIALWTCSLFELCDWTVHLGHPYMGNRLHYHYPHPLFFFTHFHSWGEVRVRRHRHPTPRSRALLWPAAKTYTTNAKTQSSPLRYGYTHIHYADNKCWFKIF